MHVLLVAYRFPPQTGGGVLRPYKFAKYLSRAGINVSVLTVESADGALPADLPRDIRVIQVEERGAMQRLRRLRRTGSPLKTRALVLARYALYHWLAPDEHSGWISPGIEAASQSELKDVDVVLTTGGPWSDFFIGEGIARRLGVPLVLDYRDPWTTGPPGWPYAPGLRARAAARGSERRIASKASMIISAHAGLPALLEEQLRLPGLSRRAHWIPNGYDSEDFAGIEPRRSDCFTLTWTGSLYGGRSLEPVIRALIDLGRSGEIDFEKVKLQIYGVSPERVRAQCPDPALLARLDAAGEIPHEQALAAILGSTVNLLVDISYDGPVMHTPGKLYEYLAAGRPVLSLSPEGVQADLIREAKGGWVTPPDDAAGLRAALRDAYTRWASGQELPRPNAAVVETFDRRRSTAKLQGLLEDLVGKREPRNGTA